MICALYDDIFRWTAKAYVDMGDKMFTLIDDVECDEFQCTQIAVEQSSFDSVLCEEHYWLAVDERDAWLNTDR